MFSQSGNVSSDSLLDRAFMAFSISMTTKIDSETVDADFAMSLENMLHPISENCVEHLWKCESW